MEPAAPQTGPSPVPWDVASLTDPDNPLDIRAFAEVTQAPRNAEDLVLKQALLTYRWYYVTHAVGQGSHQMSGNRFARQLGVSSAYVTLLRRLGRAIVLHGVEPGSLLWKDLLQYGNTKEVGRLLDRDEPVDHEELAAEVAGLSERSAKRSRQQDEQSAALRRVRQGTRGGHRHASVPVAGGAPGDRDRAARAAGLTRTEPGAPGRLRLGPASRADSRRPWPRAASPASSGRAG